MAKEMKKNGLSIPIIFLTNVGEQEKEEDFDYFSKAETRLDDLVGKIKKKLQIEDGDLVVPRKM